MIHVIMLLVTYCPLLFSALWLLLMMAVVSFFTCNVIDSLKAECDELVSVGNYTCHHAESFFYKQSLLSNWIDCVNAQVAWIFTTIYLYGAFHNILIFFYVTQFTFDNLDVKLFLIFCNSLILIVIYGNNYAWTLIGQKASLLHRSIYRLSIDTGKSFNLKVALKKLQALERLAARKMGIYIGNYIYVDNYYTLLVRIFSFK
ncbi:uncharacterized protein LOC112538879 [Tetranychus urticae]|uniref:uncharacterized protein LOC112538879 n=1 Tax=Tetranychus urticae TaxID=32264 RepID=UPI000D64D623|nr:uncharacterized protein LOC112538879 [Tetranychus urticae]